MTEQVEDYVRDQITNWWRAQTDYEIEQVVPKAVEYGSTDLAEIGRQMAFMMGLDGGLSHERLTELGIYFYIVGKIARWADALKTGRKVSDDTLHDIAVYTKMQQRNRAVGGWPFAPEEDK